MNALEHLRSLRLRGAPPCREALDWIAAQPDQSPAALYRTCPRGDWLLWYREALGLDTGDMAFVCAERARQSALRVLPPSPERDALAACAPIVDHETALAAAARAAAEAAAMAAAAAAMAAARAAAAAAATEARADEPAAIADLVRERWPEPPGTEGV